MSFLCSTCGYHDRPVYAWVAYSLSLHVSDCCFFFLLLVYACILFFLLSFGSNLLTIYLHMCIIHCLQNIHA